MKAPDKIYINNYNGNETWGNQWHTKPSTNPSTVSHEYIRKGALLEWAKERMKRLNAIYRSIPSSAVAGKYDAMKELIDKLNSM